ncbi:MAG TPA: 2Fe-2S iron-sulfur cluster-binding protein [Clostridia bacterium]|nr:2Fe-2S iron-sulfur cluster-binding protein [Clostridia bacterium]
MELRSPGGVRIIDCGKNEFIWDAAARCGLKLPAICHQGRCLTCAARLIKGYVDQSAAASYFQADSDAGFVLLCAARPRSDLVCETHQEWIMRDHRKALGLPAPYS